LYGHFDVQPAELSDGWKYDPFTLTKDPEGTGRLYGRGSSDDKGPVLGWLNVFEAHKALGIELPVNIKMCFEGMEESGSEGLDDLIEAEKDKFFKGVDCACISDNYCESLSNVIVSSRDLIMRVVGYRVEHYYSLFDLRSSWS
jgi:Cys-Gly metallodipeptidase DUG1